MPAYNASSFYQRSALLPGVLSWSFGSQNDRTPPSRFQVTAVAASGGTATLTVKLLEGLIPIVGALVSVQGTVTAGGAFNVTNIALTGVTIDSTTGVGTLTFALGGTVSTTADAGAALVPQPVIGESLNTDGTTTGKQFAIPSQAGGNKQHGLGWQVTVIGAPSGVTVNIQTADVDQDDAYTTVATSVTATSNSGSLGNINAAFVRAQQSGTGGSSPKIAVGFYLL